MHSDCNGYGLNLEAWCSKHSNASSSTNQAQRGYASNWGFSGNVQGNTSLEPYSTKARKGIKFLQWKVWQTQNPEHRHPVLVKSMANLLQKHSTPYFAKVLVEGNKKTKYFPKYGENLNGKRDMCMHQILEKCRNPNCLFYHAQAKELDSQYAAIHAL